MTRVTPADLRCPGNLQATTNSAKLSQDLQVCRLFATPEKTNKQMYHGVHRGISTGLVFVFFILWFHTTNSVFVNYLDVIPNCCYLKKKRLEDGRMKYYKQKNR